MMATAPCLLARAVRSMRRPTEVQIADLNVNLDLDAQMGPERLERLEA